MTRGSAPRRLSGDAGFTLPEMLMTIAILSIIIVPLAAIYFVSIHDTVGVSDRVVHSHDIQNASVLFSRDVQNARTVVTPNNSTLVGGVRVTSSQLALRDIAFSDAQHGFAVGDAGTLARSDDGGFTWTIDDPIVSGTLWGVDAVLNTDPSKTIVAFAVGDGGVVLKYTSTSGQWTQLSPGTGANLHAVSIKKSEGDITKIKTMVAGSGGSVSITKDSGNTWTPKNTGGGQNITGVGYKDADSGKNAWIVGDNGYLARGCDIGGGCATGWTTFNNAGSTNLTAITVLPGATNAMTVGGGGFALSISKAKDANPTFKSSTIAGVSMLTGVGVADDNNAWTTATMSDNSSAMYYCAAACTSGTPSWTQQDDGTTELLRAVTARDKFHAWAVGDNVTISTAVINDWAPDALYGGAAAFRGVALADPTHLYAVGLTGQIAVKNPSTGGPWTQVSSPATGDLLALNVNTNKASIATGPDGDVVANENNGGWVKLTSPPGSPTLRSGDIQDATHAFVVGDGGAAFFCSANCTGGGAGATWITAAGVPATANLHGVAMLDNDHALAVGDNTVVGITSPVMYVITHGGATATAVQVDLSTLALPPGTLNDVDAKDSGHVLVVGSGGVVLRCDTGSNPDCKANDPTTTWVQDSTPTSADLYGVRRLTDHDMFAVGTGGIVIAYDGSSWNADDTGVSTDLYSVDGSVTNLGSTVCTSVVNGQPCVWAAGDTAGTATILDKQNPVPALWSAQQLNQLLYVTAPVCSGGQGGSSDTFVGAFAFHVSDLDTSATYLLRQSSGEHQLVRQLCTRPTGADPNDPFDPPVEVVVAHFVVGNPTLPDTCFTTLTCSFTVSGGETPDTFTYTLSATRRPST